MPGYTPPAPLPVPPPPQQQPQFIGGVPFEQGGFYGQPTPQDVLPQQPGGFSRLALQGIPFAANLPGELATAALSGIPTGGGTTVGERINNLPRPFRIPANLALGAAPYLGASILAPETIPLMVAQQGINAGAGIGSVATGQQTLGQAAPGIGLNLGGLVAPELVGRLNRVGADEGLIKGLAEGEKPPLGAEGPKAAEPAAAEGANLPPPTDIRDVIVRKVEENQPLRESQAVPRSEQLAEKAARIREIRADPTLSPAERAAALSQAASGEMYKADFSPISITPQEHLAAVEHVAANPNLSDFDYLRIIGTENRPGALTKLLNGVGLQKNEEALLIKAFGPEMEKALANRGASSLEKNIQNAMTPPANLANTGVKPRQAEVVPIDTSLQGIENKISNQVNQAMEFATQGRAIQAASPEVRAAARERAAILSDMAKSVGEFGQQEAKRAAEGTQKIPTIPGESTVIRQATQRTASEVNAAAGKSLHDNKLWRTTLESLGIPRALQATLDLSAALRQGIVGMVGHPQRFSQSFVAQVKALFSHDFAEAVQADIKSDPLYPLLKDRVDLTSLPEDVVGKLTAREEQFQSRVLEHIPGFGRLVRASDRAFSTFTNKFRYDLAYDAVRRYMRDTGHPPTEKWLDNLGHYVNNLTGRGSTRWLGEHSATVNAAFFSPKFLVSRGQLVADLFRPGQSAEIRRLAAKDLGAFVASGVGVLAAMKLAGIGVETDPRSSDFGKYRIGGQRHDFWAGFGPIARVVAQGATREKAIPSSKGNVITDRDATGAFVQFLRNKLSPTASLAVDIHQGMASGQDVNAASLRELSFDNPILSRTAPLFIQDAIQSYNQNGAQGVATGAPLGLLGESVQSYETSQKSITRADKIRGQQMVEDSGFAPIADKFDEYDNARKAYVDKAGSADDPAARDARAHAGGKWDQANKNYIAKLHQQAEAFWAKNKATLKQAYETGLSWRTFGLTETQGKKLLGIK